MKHRLFGNRMAALATIHEKEKIILPIFDQFIELNICVAAVNTDQFGTFTGEIAREGTQIETIRRKCLAATAQTGLSIGIASEGSFGPHPQMPFVACNYELVMLKDLETDLEVCGRYLTTATNFSQKTVSAVAEALAFADSVGFPAHGLIVRGRNNVVKGIRAFEHLIQTVETELTKGDGLLYIETDMRAMHNPMRREAIAKATEDLVQRLITACPACNRPGFGKEEPIYGLPCSWCGLPTQEIKGYRMRCPTCQHTVEVISHEKEFADPAVCTFCNP
ncbi:DUF6671 family protein [Rhodoflexus sp.]